MAPDFQLVRRFPIPISPDCPSPYSQDGFFQVSDNVLPRPFANANSAGVGFGMFSNYHKSKSDSTLQPLGCLEAFASTNLRLGELGDIWEVRSK